MKLSIYDIDGQKTSQEVELSKEVFGVEPSKALMFQAVKTYLANQRQGNSKAKGRSEVSGTSAKAFRQKGTGGARRGDRKSPVLVGGGKTFGPSPRSYYLKMNKKQKQLARVSAYSDKAINESVYVFDDIQIDRPKTSQFAKILKGMELAGKKVLVLIDSYSYLDEEIKWDNSVNLWKTIRNLKNVKCQLANDVTTYEIINANYIVIQKSALETINRING